jgi:vitamin B12 transporter
VKKQFFMVAAVLFASQVQAQQDTASKSMDEVVITANKYPQKQSSTGKVLTVISRQVLQNNTGRTLAQVLNEQAGVIVNGAQNTLGTNQVLYMRGAGAANTLILVDGVPANDASGISGEFDLNHFSIDQVERVEILKGAQSVLYGSDAVAGVINIITKKQQSKRAFNFNVVAAGGTYGTAKTAVALSGKSNIFTYNLQYNKLRSDGFSSAEDKSGNNHFDKDGFNQDGALLNVSAKASENWQLRFFTQFNQYQADLDDASFMDDKNNRLHNKNIQAGIASIYQFGRGTFNVNINLNNTRRKLSDEKNVPNDPMDFDPYNGLYKGKTIFAEAFTNINLAKQWGLVAGADIRQQKADIETTYGNLGSDSLKSTQYSLYASILLKQLGGFSAEAGTRFTHHSVFGSALTYSVNPSYIINKKLKLFANIASGFRAPSIYNLASEYGNKTLEPEKSASVEAGLQYSHAMVNVRATYFNRHIKEVIIFKSTFVPPYGQYINADEQKDKGAEMELSIKPSSQWSITANYAYVTGKIYSQSPATQKDTSIYNLYRRPKNSFNATVAFQPTKAIFASIGYRWVDKRDDLYFNPDTYQSERKTLASYYNLDIYASCQLHRVIKLFADIRNVTNQTCYDIYGYNNRRFNMMAGVVVNF